MECEINENENELIVTFCHLLNLSKNYILLTEFQFRLHFTWFVFFWNDKQV